MMNDNGKLGLSRSTGVSETLRFDSASACEHLATAFTILSEATPDRMSIRQMLAFLMIGYANAKGQSIALTQVRELAGEALGQSIERTIQVFFPPTKNMPSALNWVYQEVDEDDRRKKYLKLTAQGRWIINQVTQAMVAAT